MAVNLVSLIMQFLTPDMIGRIASALGLDRNNTQTAIGAAIPGLLAGLSGVAAQPGGAQKTRRHRKAANWRPRQLCQHARCLGPVLAHREGIADTLVTTRRPGPDRTRRCD